MDELSDFLVFLNSAHPNIRFTMELEQNCILPFMDVCIERNSEGLLFSVFRKPTHTDRYIHRDSAHPIGVFKGLTRCLSGRIGAICSDIHIPREENKVYETLRANGYSAAECLKWWTPSYKQSIDGQKRKEEFRGSIPHVPGVSERIRNILRKADIHVGMKPTSTLRQLLVKKRPVPATELGIIYQLPCSSAGCSWSYVGESSRTLDERKKEHIKSVRELDVMRSEVAQHALDFSHSVDFDRMKVIDRESNWRKRVIKEAWWTKRLSSSNRTKHSISNFWFQ